jgi:hypothetical protein
MRLVGGEEVVIKNLTKFLYKLSPPEQRIELNSDWSKILISKVEGPPKGKLQ